jgi:predicted transposase/invertase (TIGR01784 family)
LQRWLVYFDKHSPARLIEEVLEMDRAIQEMQKKIDWIQGDPALLRSYLRYEKAASDEITRIYGAKKEGREEGKKEGREEGKKEGKREEKIEVAQNLKALGDSSEKIAKVTGLSIEEIAKL